MRKFLMGLVILATAPLVIAAGANAADTPVEATLVLRGGTIFVGDGSPGAVGDVAIKDGKIVAVGRFELGRVEQILDCTGLCVSPGFIDLHTHSDQQVVAAPTRACVNYLIQGCTTSVTGNCGSGPTDVRAYYEKIDAAGAGTNVAHLLPQGSLRERVVGSIERRATADELKQMEQLVDQAMRDGAWGMSTGLIYVPSVYADTEELITLNTVVGRHGGLYASHIRGEGSGLLTAVTEAIQIGERGNTPTHISHFKSSGTENWGLIRQAAAAIETARQRGRTVTADQYPYTASSTSLEATLFPTWARSGGTRELVRRLENPDTAKRLRADVDRDLERTQGGETIVIARYARNPDWAGQSIKQLAQSQNKSARDVAEEIIRNGGAAVVNFSMSDEDVRFAMQLPWVATASDGRSYLPGSDRPHPRSYGTFARKIGRYAIKDEVLSLAQAIRSASGLPAEILGLTDRGTLAVGMAADIAVFDPARYIDTATYDQPHQYSTGMQFVFVNGIPAVSRGVPTGALAGIALVRKSPIKGKNE